MKKAAVLLLLLFVDVSVNQAQTVHPNSFTEKYWGYYFTGGMRAYYNHSQDTLRLILCMSKSELQSKRSNGDEINGGVIFHNDGSAQLFRAAARCGTPPPQERRYQWRLQNNVIVVVDTFGQRTFFKPVVIFNGKTVLETWQ